MPRPHPPPADPRLALAAFAVWASDPSNPWRPYPWLRFLAREAQQCITYGGNLLVNVPPQHGKSLLLAKWLLVWILENHPRKRIVYTTYESSLAREWGEAVRDVFAQHGGGKLRTTLKHGSKSKARWLTNEGGGLVSIGIGGAVTGRPADVLIVDDPYKGFDEALSPTIRGKVERAWDSKLRTRVAERGSKIVIHTRWCEADLTGHIAKQADYATWKHIVLPALARENDPLGRRPGEALCPELRSRAWLELERDTISPHIWAGVYDQLPGSIDGEVWKPEWWVRYGVAPDVSYFDVLAQSWDFTFGSQTASASYITGQVWGKKDAERWLLDQVRFRGGFDQMLDATRALSAKWPQATAKYVEAKALGTAVVDTLKRQIPGLILVEPSGSKVARALAVVPELRAGNVRVPDLGVTPWAAAFHHETRLFPKAESDDQVDAASQFLLQARLMKKPILMRSY